MEAALLMAIAMILTAPLIGYVRATAWAEKHGMVRKEELGGESIAMSFH